METISTGLLIIIGLVLFAQQRNGTLPQWMKAKFLNSSSATPVGDTADGILALASAQLGTQVGGDIAAVTGTTNPAGAGGFIPPVMDYTVTQAYHGNVPGGHPGIDLACPTGTPVFASRAGVVTRASWFGGYGNCVDIDCGGGYSTRFGHLESFKCAVGQHVDQGTVVALSDSTGDSTGPHVHFEIRLNGNTVDPGPLAGINEAGK